MEHKLAINDYYGESNIGYTYTSASSMNISNMIFTPLNIKLMLGSLAIIAFLFIITLIYK